jgi:hypothetical protein
MAGKPFHKGASLYNYILKQATAINNALPKDRQLSLADRRKIISSTLYPKYKAMPLRSIRIGDIRADLTKQFAKVPRDPACDVNYIPPFATLMFPTF